MKLTTTRTMIPLTSEDKEQMYRNGSTVRVWYRKEDTREIYHKDFKTIQEANEYNKKATDTIKQFSMIGRKEL